LSKKFLIACIVVLAFGNLNGQDIHFTQFLYSPLTLNPALTGNFEGRYRLGMNHRQQWRSISQPFQTTGLWADSRQFLNAKNINLGLSFYYDKAGTSDYNTLHFSVPVSYRFTLSGDSTHAINVGIQPAFNHQSLNTDKLTSDAQWNGRRFDNNLPLNENFQNTNTTTFDLALGVTYQINLKKMNWTAGMSVYNLFEPKSSFLLGDDVRIPRRYNFHLGGKIDLKGNWFATPGLVYSRQRQYNELVFGSELNYVMNDAPYSYRVLFFGLWNRGKDAGILNLGMYYNSWRVGLSYDVNYSPLHTASNYRGGWEISIIYILRDLLPKRLNYKYCPDYL
tara:strand:- start:26511 stop:27518 length:1008 start_codon:yes stop_codon:yes gene_type:complete